MAGSSLTQTAASSFPDRGAVGLEVALVAGSDNEYLEVDLGAEYASLSVRMMVRQQAALANGNMRAIVGTDAAGTETLALILKPSGTATRLKDSGNNSHDWTTTALPRTYLKWDCLEFHISPDIVKLYLNGVLETTVTSSISFNATRYLRWGSPKKNSQTTGTLYFDELAVTGRLTLDADAASVEDYIGPVAVAPTTDDATDAKRWAYIFEAPTAASEAAAEGWRSAKGIPYANLIGLTTANAEGDTTANYQANVRNAVKTYLDLNTAPEIDGLIVGHLVQGRLTTPSPALSVAATIADLTTETPAANPNYLAGLVDVDDLPTRASLLGGSPYLVADANASDEVVSQTYITYAAALSVTAADGQVLSTLDATEDRLSTQVPTAAWATAAAFDLALEQQEIRLARTVTLDANGYALELHEATSAGDPFSGGDTHEALVVTIAASSAANFNTGSEMLREHIVAGYAFGLGNVDASAVAAADQPNPAALFAALRAGWTWAEALAVACPRTAAPWRPFGDPMAALPMPLAGFNIRRNDTGALLAATPANDVNHDIASIVPAGTWTFDVSRTDKYGTESDAVQFEAELAADGSASSRYRTIKNLRRWLVSGGYIGVNWQMPADASRTTPASFQIAEAADLGTIIATVTVDSTANAYETTLGAFADGSTQALRIRPTDGANPGDWLAFDDAVVDAAGPDAPVLLGVTD